MGENELFSFGIRLSLFWTLGNSKHYAKIDHMQKLEPKSSCDMRGMDHIVWYPYGSFYIDILGLVWHKLLGLMMIRTNEP